MLYAFLVGCSIATCEFAASCVSMNHRKGRLAQWWRRCLTSTRPAVRTRHRPPAISAGQRLNSFWPASLFTVEGTFCANFAPILRHLRKGISCAKLCVRRMISSLVPERFRKVWRKLEDPATMRQIRFSPERNEVMRGCGGLWRVARAGSSVYTN